MEKTQYLLDEILAVTKSKKSLAFYRKAIKILGPGIVEMELGELKNQIRTGDVDSPAKYFTTLLTKQLTLQEGEILPAGRELATYKPEDQQQLFAELKLLNETAFDKEKTSLDIVYNEELIKIPTILGSNFFTISTNKAKSDEVPIKLQTIDGTLNATLLRGRITKEAKEWGILTSFDGKVFLALIHLWQEKGCRTSQYKDNRGETHLSGIVSFSVNELIRRVYANLSKPSKSDKIRFINSITNLSNLPYNIYITEDGSKFSHGFTLLSGVSLLGIKRGRQTEKTGMVVTLSPEITRQYLKQRYLNRPEQLTKLKNEIAFLLWFNLEPKLMSLDGNEYHAELRKLITDMNLPKAEWHKKANHRRRVFEKAIAELSNKKTSSGKLLRLKIIKGLFDYVLVVELV
jgi:hypothetical protein